MAIEGYPDGIYRLDYRADDEGSPIMLSAFAALSGTAILGSDRYGALLTGELCEAVGGVRRLALRIGVPPGGELATGLKTAGDGAVVEVAAELPERVAGGVAVTADVAGAPLAICLHYVGPLPGAAPSSDRRSRSDERAAPHSARDHRERPRHSR